MFSALWWIYEYEKVAVLDEFNGSRNEDTHDEGDLDWGEQQIFSRFLQDYT